MNKNEMSIRVPYADVDKMGVVYYANYLIYFERGRTELLREAGCDYAKVEKEYQLYLPVVEVNIKYLAPAKYDDLIRVVTKVNDIGRASISFEYEIFNGGNIKLIEGFSRHPCVNAQWKPTKIPAFIIELLK